MRGEQVILGYVLNQDWGTQPHCSCAGGAMVAAHAGEMIEKRRIESTLDHDLERASMVIQQLNVSELVVAEVDRRVQQSVERLPQGRFDSEVAVAKRDTHGWRRVIRAVQ